MEFNALDVANGDCKAIGTPRTAEEVYAVRNLGIDPELVRKGLLQQKHNKTEELDTIEVSIEDLRDQYLIKFGTKVPSLKNKDTKWIVNKLNN